MEIIYHGSPEKFETAQPKRNKRVNKNKEVIWDRDSFHGTPHKWIALVYTRTRKDNHTTGVDLFEQNKIIDIYGPTNLNDALAELYGEGGYLYEFDAADFSHDDGLGNLERFTSKILTPLAITRIEDPVAAMKQLGVEFKFSPYTEL